MESETLDVKHNETANRFEVGVGDDVAVLAYVREGGGIIYTHTEVPLRFRGQGVANLMAKTAMEYAKSEGLQVVATCPFVQAYIRKHPEYNDIVINLDELE